MTDIPEPVKAETTTARPRGKKLVWIIALVVVLVAAGAFVVYEVSARGADAAPGECAMVTGADDAAKVEIVDCDDKSASFKVASKRDGAELGCPEGAYREVRTDGGLLCLMPNFVADTCYEADDANQSFRVSGCESDESIKITKVIDGSTDPSGCPAGNGLGYPEPPVVFCIDTPGAA
ncbi:MAG: hypothetical protein M3548_01305 [Actinomycetota bacterium]|nr:hypothetical protein [Actinomycetota bacterium]